jgi:uncharacterized tellurite resistance protein B-like protein
MTPAEHNIVKSLIAVAWADGRMESSEATVVEGLLAGFDASPEEEAALLEYAKTPRSLERDVPLQLLNSEDRELLLSNAALLTLADGEQTEREHQVLARLAELLGFDVARSEAIVSEALSGMPVTTRSQQP